MLVNVSFDDEGEELDFVDVIEVPDKIIEQLNSIQRDFLSWMFDKSSNHKYWVIENGIKRYCAYSTEAFVEWLNENVLNNEQATLIVESTNDIDPKLPIMYF